MRDTQLKRFDNMSGTTKSSQLKWKASSLARIEFQSLKSSLARLLTASKPRGSVQTVIWIKRLLISRITNIIKSLQHITFFLRRSNAKLVATTSLSKWWVTRREISTAQATLIIWLSIVSKRCTHLARPSCTRLWVAVSRLMESARVRQELFKPRKDLTRWIQRQRSTWNRWTRYRKRELNQQLRPGWQTWCQTSRTLISMLPQIVP